MLDIHPKSGQIPPCIQQWRPTRTNRTEVGEQGGPNNRIMDQTSAGKTFGIATEPSFPFDTIAVPILVLEHTGTVLSANVAARDLLGGEGRDLVNLPVAKLLPVSGVSELLEKVGKSNEPSIVLTGSSESAGQFFLEVRATEWHTDDGQKRYTLVLQNVTRRHLAELRLQATLERWDYALTGAHIGVFEVDVTTGKSIVSETWKTLMGLSEKPADTDWQAEWQARIHPEDLPVVQAADQACFEGRSLRSLTEYRMRLQNKGGWRWMCSDAVAVSRDHEGCALRLIGAQTDITEAREAKDVLQRLIVQFQSLFANAPIGNAIVGLDGRWLWVNGALCDLFGYSEEALLRTDFQTLTHPDDIAANVAQVDLLLAGTQSSYSTEKRYIRADGSIIWGHLSVALVRDEAGRPVHFISQVVDVSELRKLADMKGEFVSTVSHELRTPLTSILAALDLIAFTGAKHFADDTKRLLDIARQNGEQLKRLIDDILDFDKVSSGRMKFSLSRENVSSLLEQAVLANMPYSESHGVEYLLKSVEPDLTCVVDPGRFQQVVDNLLSNAAKFSDTGKVIEVGARRMANLARISITNQGAEIPAEIRDLVFKPFFQVAASSTRKRGGTGLGLSICTKIVEQMGGQIGYDCSDGRTTFWFTVPIGDILRSAD